MSDTRLPLGEVFELSCGCRAEWLPWVGGMRWRIIKRCVGHPQGDVPVQSMRFVAREALGA